MVDNIASPRLIDVFGVAFTQDDVDFAIPRLHQDIPLYVDPFLLWISDKPGYRGLHDRLVSFFRLVSELVRDGHPEDASQLLAGCEEPRAMGLGYASGSRMGSNIGPKLIALILEVHQVVPQLREGRIRHIEEMQLVVPGIAEDRMSDIACSILWDFFVSYTEQQCRALGIPTRATRLGNVFDPSRQLWVPTPEAGLPYNPIDDTPILFAPLALLRHLPWINYENYYQSSFAPRVLQPQQRQKRVAKQAVLKFNARNYVEVERYVTDRERIGEHCKPDPLFRPLAPATISRLLKKSSVRP